MKDKILFVTKSSFQSNPLIDSEQEKIRQTFKPSKIRYLMIGESMPAGGTFFYFQNSFLYQQTITAFLQVFNWPHKEFLKYFKSNGFYLDDLCQEPINHLTENEKRKARTAYEDKLSERLKAYKPLIVFSTPKSIFNNVNSALNKAGLKLEHYSLPFPSHGNQRKYNQELVQLLENKVKPLFSNRK